MTKVKDSDEYEIRYGEFQDLKLAVKLANWIGAFILIILLGICAGNVTCIVQIGNVKTEMALLKDEFSDHLIEEKGKNDFFKGFFAGSEKDGSDNGDGSGGGEVKEEFYVKK